jgi:HSP20 family protein
LKEKKSKKIGSLPFRRGDDEGGYKMAIIRWDPFRDMVTLREKMNRMFEDVFTGRSEEGKELAQNTWAPSVDIYENEIEVVLTAEVPGIEEKDIEIKIEDNTLSLKGERKFKTEMKEENYHRIERAYGSFYRAFTLPNSIDPENIRAEHENGVLKITMPKRQELKPRKVKILKPSGPEKLKK